MLRLHLKEAGVASARFNQLFVAALLYDFSFFHNADLVGHAYSREAVAYKQGRAAVLSAASIPAATASMVNLTRYKMARGSRA